MLPQLILAASFICAPGHNSMFLGLVQPNKTYDLPACFTGSVNYCLGFPPGGGVGTQLSVRHRGRRKFRIINQPGTTIRIICGERTSGPDIRQGDFDFWRA